MCPVGHSRRKHLTNLKHLLYSLYYGTAHSLCLCVKLEQKQKLKAKQSHSERFSGKAQHNLHSRELLASGLHFNDLKTGVDLVELRGTIQLIRVQNISELLCKSHRQ